MSMHAIPALVAGAENNRLTLLYTPWEVLPCNTGTMKASGTFHLSLRGWYPQKTSTYVQLLAFVRGTHVMPCTNPGRSPGGCAFHK